MSFAFAVYLISIVNALSFFLFAVGLLIGLAAVFIIVGYEKPKAKITVPMFVLTMFLWMVCAIIPNKNDAYIIAGAYAAEKVYESDIGQDTIKLIHAKIKEQLALVSTEVKEAK